MSNLRNSRFELGQACAPQGTPIGRLFLPVALLFLTILGGCITIPEFKDGIEIIPSESAGPEWSYEGKTGPKHWAELSPEWALASSGTEQSPIDITEPRSSSVLYPLNFSYRPTPLNLVNNGHTIQQNFVPGSSVEIMGKTYHLAQFHFHSRSEHRVKGRQFDLEMHLVHQDAEGKLLVVGILFETGAENPFLAQFFDQLPATAHQTLASSGSLLNVSEVLPEDRSYYYYQGSLTTPPCTEGVQWYVLRQPQQLSTSQLTAFRAIFSNNARPVQPLHARTVWESQ